MVQTLPLKCENLHKKIGKKDILKGISLQVEKGDILGFIGPNGAGKTTTIKLILGLQSITDGNVKINGFDIQKQFTKAISGVGAIVENPDLYMYLTGYENLKLISKLYKNVDKRRIDEVVKLVGLEKRINDKVSKYSLGMRQRLGVAQAILHKPNLLILDEPTNGLDPEGIKAMRELLVKLAKEEKMGVLISSHNLAELDSFCNKVCIIKNGVIVETSNIEDAKKVGEHKQYLIKVDNIEKALKTIKEISNNIEYDLKTSIQTDSMSEKYNRGNLKIYIEEEQMPEIIQKLVENNIKIYEAKQETISLEDAFLKKTGGNVIE